MEHRSHRGACVAGVLLALGLLLAGVPQAHAAPTLWGYTGLINIPTAELVPDGTIIVGAGYVEQPYGLPRQPPRDNAIYYASVGFFPFLELDVHVAIICGENWDHSVPGYGFNKDRSIGMRLRLLPEGDSYPAVALGAHDLAPKGWDEEGVAVTESSALYLVGTKTVGPVRVHGGYAVDWLSDTHPPQFEGAFGGVDLALTRWLAAMLEHDTHKASAGLRVAFALRGLLPWRRLGGDALSPVFGFDIVSLGLKKLGGGTHFQFNL